MIALPAWKIFLLDALGVKTQEEEPVPILRMIVSLHTTAIHIAERWDKLVILVLD